MPIPENVRKRYEAINLLTLHDELVNDEPEVAEAIDACMDFVYCLQSELKEAASKLADAEKQAEYNGEAAREVAERLKSAESRLHSMREALELLRPGLILDLRYATDDDDIDALRSRVDTIEAALAEPRTVVERPSEK